MKPTNTTKPGGWLVTAFDKMSYEWLSINAPDLVMAIEKELGYGMKPEEVRFVAQSCNGPDRDGIARRCEQAARYIAMMREAAA